MKAKLWDKNWKYTPASATDIRKRFAKIRKEQKEAKEAAERNIFRIVARVKA